MTTLLDILKLEEGWRETPYYCSEKYPTVGWGFKIGPKGVDLALYQFTLPPEAGNAWLESIVRKLTALVLEKLYRECPAIANNPGLFTDYNAQRLMALVSMAYQMGLTGLGNFKKMLSAINEGNFELAAAEALNSRWAKQTPDRALRMAYMIEHNKIPDYYKSLHISSDNQITRKLTVISAEIKDQ